MSVELWQPSKLEDMNEDWERTQTCFDEVREHDDSITTTSRRIIEQYSEREQPREQPRQPTFFTRVMDLLGFNKGEGR